MSSNKFQDLMFRLFWARPSWDQHLTRSEKSSLWKSNLVKKCFCDPTLTFLSLKSIMAVGDVDGDGRMSKEENSHFAGQFDMVDAFDKKDGFISAQDLHKMLGCHDIEAERAKVHNPTFKF